MSFVQDCIGDSLPIWKRCMETDFLRGVADGTLPEDCFKGYIVDDSLYLREYARVFAWGILRAGTMEEIRTYHSLLSFVRESEDVTRQYYLQRYGLDDAVIEKLPLRPQNRAYVEEMHSAARNGEGTAECMMAALPCMLSYAWIFCEMLKSAPGVLDTPYGKFVGDYAGISYEALCGRWTGAAEKACAHLSQQRKAECLRIFRACSLHELRFWEMCQAPRTDL